MEPEAKPTPPEELVGKDELDEDDEMELSSDELVETADVSAESPPMYQLAHRPVPTGPLPSNLAGAGPGAPTDNHVDGDGGDGGAS